MRPLKARLSITLDQDLVEKIRELAEEDERSFSQYINLVMRQHVEKTPTERSKLRQQKAEH